jgi:sugar-specific transcriptional regulator TrmB
LGAEHPKKRIEITEALKIRSQQLYHILNNLKDKHVIKNSSEPTCSFSAVPIEEALDMLIETKKKQQKALKTTKKELLSIWQATIEKD